MDLGDDFFGLRSLHGMLPRRSARSGLDQQKMTAPHICLNIVFFLLKEIFISRWDERELK